MSIIESRLTYPQPTIVLKNHPFSPIFPQTITEQFSLGPLSCHSAAQKLPVVCYVQAWYSPDFSPLKSQLGLVSLAAIFHVKPFHWLSVVPHASLKAPSPLNPPVYMSPRSTYAEPSRTVAPLLRLPWLLFSTLTLRLLFFFYGTGNWTHGLVHAKQAPLPLEIRL